MNCYVYSMSSFALVGKEIPVIDYDVAMETVTDDTSTVVVPLSSVTASVAGQWLIIGGALLYISDVSIGDKTATLECKHLRSAFDRDLVLSDLPTLSTLEGFISAVIWQEFVYNSDGNYALPYLSAYYTGATAYHDPEVDGNGVFNFADFLQDCAENYHVRLIPTLGVGVMELAVSSSTSFGGVFVVGHDDVILSGEPSFYASATAKVTVRQTASGTTTSTNYYLYEDGTVGTDGTRTDRASGAWRIISVDSGASSADILARVRSEMRNGNKRTNVQFYVSDDMAIGSSVTMHVAGRQVKGWITYKGIKKGHDRYLYKVGDYASTVNARLNSYGAALRRIT